MTVPGSASSKAELSVIMARAIASGDDWPPAGVPDTPDNRALWDEITANVQELRAQGIQPDVPSDWAAFTED
jgi:hypothetical protein